MTPRLTPKQIADRARYYGLDPDAVQAVGRSEGYSGRIGDGGHAYGPFQLNNAGGVITGSRPGVNDRRTQDWAWSQQGVDFALQGMAKVAKGRHGADAVKALVSQYERPADIQGEISRSLGYLGGAGAGAPPAPTPAASPVGSAVQQNPQQGIFQALGRVNGGDYSGFYQQLGQTLKRGNESIIQSSPVAGQLGGDRTTTTMPNGSRKWVSEAAGADRGGVQIKPQTLAFVTQVAQQYGKPLTIGTGTNHNQYVAGTRRQSGHWTGDAADIPASGAQLTKLGQSALIAAGADPKWARKQHGGLFNIGGKQIIFNSMEGGNHFNHLHVGIHR